MATSFPNTMRSLEAIAPATVWRRLALALLVLSAWALWMTFARVSVYASSARARLETEIMPHRIAAPESGRVAVVALALGRVVEADDLLIELDTSVEQKLLAEAEVQVQTLEPRIAALGRRIELEEAARAWKVSVDSQSLRRADVDARSLELGSANREQIRGVYDRLREAELASRIDALNSQKDADEYRLKASGAQVDLQRLRATSSYNDARAQADIAELSRQLVELQGQQRAAGAVAETARAQIERRKVRAQLGGKLGNITRLQVGDVVRVGDPIATVIPEDEVRVVAELAPTDAGRIAPGQKARMRLDGFAWTQYGALDALVERVASEPGDGSIRVELGLDPRAHSGAPIQHGLPGVVDIAVEQVSPWTLLLRGLATAVTASRPEPAPAVTQAANSAAER